MYCIFIILSDLDNCKWSGPDFCPFAIKKFAIINKFFQSIIILFKILVKFSYQSSSDVFYFIKTYLINQNIKIQFQFDIALLYFQVISNSNIEAEKNKNHLQLKNNYSMVKQ